MSKQQRLCVIFSKTMSENIANTQRVAWNTVKCLLQKVLSGGSLSEEDCVELSKSVRRYCGKRKIKAVTLPRIMRLYARLRRLLEKHIESLKNIALTLSDSCLLSFYEESWLNYSATMECINKHFKYASRLCCSTYDSPHGDEFYMIGLSAWHSGLFDICKKELTRTIVEEIMKERRGEKVSKRRLSLIMKSFITEEDKDFFESEFLEKSGEFYATQNFKPSAPLTIPDYIEWAESIIQSSTKRPGAYLKKSTLKNLTNIVSSKVIEDTIEIISEEFSNLLSEGKIEGGLY
ncbi:unnamed protein product [Hymenolepis diminuta]|uniref:Cullin domain-containing protein n=1 Tax=Hymenolepis diminuta TaxID=6216 RepID=A0A0R3SL83_HYMDI|nr:unnamed protein product [Hymenolepis diminuta]